MLKHANRTDILWGYAAQLLNVGAGIVLLPFSLHYLGSAELGLWYVFVALAGLAQLLDFGFQPTIARQTAYVYSGVRTLQAQGLPTAPAGPLQLALLADLVAASSHLYRWVTAAAALVLFLIGSFYLLSLVKTPAERTAVLWPWLIYAAGVLLNLYYGFFNGLLQGRGEQTAANKMIALSRGCMVLVSVPLLVAGFGLMGLAVASLASALLGRILVMRIFYHVERADAVYLRDHAGNHRALAPVLWQSAWRQGVVQLGAFMILRVNLFIASSALGLQMAASYGLSLQLLGLLGTMSTMLFTLQMPKMNALQTQQPSEELKTLFSSAVLAAWIVYLVGAVCVMTLASPALELMKSNTSLLPSPWLGVLLVIMLLEMNHSLSAMYITTINRVPFVKAALVSGVAIIGLGMTLLHLTGWHIGALILAQGMVQLAYNNWKWPAVACHHLQLNVASLLAYGRSGLTRYLRPA